MFLEFLLYLVPVKIFQTFNQTQPKFDFFLTWKKICSYRWVKFGYRLFKRPLVVRLNNCLLDYDLRRKISNQNTTKKSKPKHKSKQKNPPPTQTQDPSPAILQYLPPDLKKSNFPSLLGVLLTQSSFVGTPTVSIPDNSVRQIINKMWHIGC